MNNLQLSLIVIFQELNRSASLRGSSCLTVSTDLYKSKYFAMQALIDSLSIAQIRQHLSTFGIKIVIADTRADQIKTSALSLIDTMFSIIQNKRYFYYTIRRLTSSTGDKNHQEKDLKPLTGGEKRWYDIWDVNECEKCRKNLLNSALHGITSVADLQGGF
jgi:hypothetical protein